MRSLCAVGAFVILAGSGCIGSGSDGMPTPSSVANASLVNIVGQKGTQSFDPNPAPIAQGAVVVWHNMDTTTHRIVMNDGSFDSGDITPGGSSLTMRLGSTGGGYHCTIHPITMFGSINATSEPAPSPPGY